MEYIDLSKEYYIEVNGKPVPVEYAVWRRWFADTNRTIAKTDVAGVHISTVFLSGEYNDETGHYETLVERNGKEVDCIRYNTRAEAVEGHTATVEYARGGVYE